jgi:glycosyltransferase involved in cell wall biosynthesis
MLKTKDDYDLRKNNILFIGSQYIENGTLLFIEIARIILKKRNDVRFSCIDRFGKNHALRDVVYAESQTELLRDKFIILPNVPSQELMAYINDARIGISPNLNVPKQVKAIPTKLFEYMAGRIPIVASDLPNNRLYVQDNSAGLLADPDDPESFAEAILYLLNNPVEAKKYGEAGKRCFVNKFTWESQEPTLDAYYRKILSAYMKNEE